MERNVQIIQIVQTKRKSDYEKRIICTISIFVLVVALCSGCSGNPF